nr:hypothetical protein [Tanacetum cinerariifolium]
MNKKNYSFDLETFRDMFQICPKVPGQKLIDALFKEEILVFMSNLGYPGNIKSLSEVKVEILPQPWRTFATIINKCLSAKTDQAPKAPQSKRLKATAKSKTQFYSSNSSGLGADEGTGVKPGVPDVPKYAYDDVAEGKNVKQEKLEEAKTNKGEEVNINLEGRDTKMTDASRTIAQTTQVIEDTHVTITPVNPEDVPVTIVAETPPSYATTLPPPPIPLITHMKQTPVPSPITVPSSSLQNLPNFGSLFRFDNRLKTLEQDFSEFKQTNQFAEAISSIPGIVDKYLANRMNDAVKIVVQLQSNRLREEAQAKNKTSSINLMKVSRKSSRRKLKSTDILDIYGDTVTIKRCRDDKDNNEEPSVGSDQGSKRRRAGKEPESTSSPKEKTSKSTGKSKEGSISHHKSTGKSTHVEEPIHTVVDLEEPTHQEFVTGVTEDQPVDETSQLPDWFQKPTRPLTPDRDWNKTLPDNHGPIQPWISTLAQKENLHESFDELMDTPLNFSAFMMNQLKVDTLTPELLANPTFELMKGLCKSLVELEYFFEEVYKATTDQLDWNNPEGQQYPHHL